MVLKMWVLHRLRREIAAMATLGGLDVLGGPGDHPTGAIRLGVPAHRGRRCHTQPYSPWTNGKGEALIKTLLREWAYRFAYPTSAHRARALAGRLTQGRIPAAIVYGPRMVTR